MEMGLILLAHAAMPTTYQDHSFTSSIYLMNRLLTNALPESISPFYRIHNKQPDYKSLKIFYCTCYPHLRSYNQHKLKFMSSKCVYLGVSPTHKGHKCMHIAAEYLYPKMSFSMKRSFHSRLTSKWRVELQIHKSLKVLALSFLKPI